jgi:hypothetical protein
VRLWRRAARRVRSSKGFQNLRFRTMGPRIRLRHRFRPEEWSDADPFKIVHVPVDRISLMTWIPRHVRESEDLVAGANVEWSRARFHKWENLGRVLGGDWDLKRRLFGTNLHHRLLTDRFIRGMAWEESEAFHELTRRVLAGEALWHGCRTIPQIQARCEEVERLYESMRSEGYRLQKEMGDGDLRRRFDEVVLNVGRNGELLYNSSGSHRILLARALGISSVPVRFLVRHVSWQRVRNRLRRPEGVEGEAEGDPGFMPHPDLDDIDRKGDRVPRPADDSEA